MDCSFRDDIGVETVAEVDRVDVVTVCHTRLARVLCLVRASLSFTTVRSYLIVIRSKISEFTQPDEENGIETYHSRSLYMIVKKTCKNRLTALIRTANRYNHASPDIMTAFGYRVSTRFLV